MEVTFSGMSMLAKYREQLEQVATTAPAAMAKEMNVVGAAARKSVIRAEAKQIGLPVRTMNRALKEHRALPGHPVYGISAEGGNIGLKSFGPRVVGRGIIARPWGVSTEYQGAFVRGGRNQAVFAPSLHGQVFRRTGNGREIAMVKSGAYIPTELTRGNALRTFEITTEALGPAMLARLAKLMA